MSINIINYLLLHQVFSDVLLVLYDKCFGKYSKRYLFLMQTRQTSFKYHWKLKETSFYYQVFPVPLLIAGLLSFVCGRYINEYKCLIFVKLKNICQLKRFLTNFAKHWKGCNFTASRHINFQLWGKVTFLWKLSEIGKNQQNEIASSTASNSKKNGPL